MYQQVFELHADILKALAHPKRLEIIHLLREQTLTVTQIQEMLDLPQANLSQHLTILRQAGVVANRKIGKQIFYRLSHKNFIKASDLLRQVLIEKHQNQKIADELTLKMTDLVPLTIDPVCGMRLSPKTAAFATKYKNENYYFCAAGCYKGFGENPEKYRDDTY
ncbi:metalloregulator ArsR/SmtB family transcription factor [Candidatus Curtissbacteria bacterium]|nr:metalloregulator ArsR/SmtB family transcription factor [Candidatus Curtissbacteria bacterium]